MARKSNPVYYDANGNVVQPPAKKKGGCLKYALIGLLALIVIAVLASMMGGGSNSTSEGGRRGRLPGRDQLQRRGSQGRPRPGVHRGRLGHDR